MMGAGLPQAAYRSSFQTASKLLWLNAVVVGVKGKGITKCQVSNKKMHVNEPMKC
jgi:hypothetical protein